MVVVMMVLLMLVGLLLIDTGACRIYGASRLGGKQYRRFLCLVRATTDTTRVRWPNVLQTHATGEACTSELLTPLYSARGKGEGGCGRRGSVDDITHFSATTNRTSAGSTPGPSSPSPGKVIFVPFFQPGLTEMVSCVDASASSPAALNLCWGCKGEVISSQQFWN